MSVGLRPRHIPLCDESVLAATLQDRIQSALLCMSSPELKAFAASHELEAADSAGARGATTLSIASVIATFLERRYPSLSSRFLAFHEVLLFLIHVVTWLGVFPAGLTPLTHSTTTTSTYVNFSINPTAGVSRSCAFPRLE